MASTRRLLAFWMVGICWMPLLGWSQCVTDISGTGIGSGVACTHPNAYAYSSATYTSTVTQSGWTYVWTVSANGTISYGQGTSQIGVRWNSAPTGACDSWVNLEVSNGSGCVYNYGTANGAPGKCVNVQQRPSPNHTWHGMPQNNQFACKYYPALNNLETYTASSPCTGCVYSWSATGGNIASGQGSPVISVQWLNASQYQWSNRLNLYVTSPNGCSASWSTQEGASQATYVEVREGYPIGPISGPTTTYTNGCTYTYTGSFSCGVFGGGLGIWNATGGTVVGIRHGVHLGLYGWHYDTVDVIWNSVGSHTLTLANHALGFGCGSGASMQVNTLAWTGGNPSISGPSSTSLCQGSSASYQALNHQGYSLNWTVQNGIIVSGQGTPTIQVVWNSAGQGKVTLQASLGGCTQVREVFVTVNSGTAFSFGPDVYPCTSTYLLSGPPNQASYQWSTGATTRDITVSNSGNYWLLATNQYGCESFDLISVNFQSAPLVSLGQDSMVCGDSLRLQVPLGMGAYLWSNGSTSNSTLATTSGNYSVAVTATNGCIGRDTVSVGILGANHVSLGPDTVSCSGAVALMGPANQSSYLWSTGATTSSILAQVSGSYVLEGIDMDGCKGQDTIQVTVGQSTSATLAQTGCGSITLNNQTFTTSGNYTQTLTNASGCDSVLTLNLTVLPSPAAPTITPSGATSICPGDSVTLISSPRAAYLWSNGATTPSITVGSPGTYWVSGSDVQGCSSVSPNLTISLLPQVTNNQYVNLCWGQSVTVGNHVYNSSGTYLDTLPNPPGCPTIMTTHLTVAPPIDTSLVVNGATLISNVLGASYQWVRCNYAFAPIPGATGQSFTPTQNGIYAVVITRGSCTDTSECVNVNLTGFQAAIGDEIRGYPNPNDGRFTVDFGREMSLADVRVYDLAGKLVHVERVENRSSVQLNLHGLSDGVYGVEVRIGESRKVLRMTKL